MTTVELTEIGYSTGAVCRIVGCTLRQADYWDRAGLLSPEISAADGSGSARRYSHRDLLLLLVASELMVASRGGGTANPMGVRRLRPIIDYLRPRLDSDLSDALLFICGDRFGFARTAEELVSVVLTATETLTIVKLGDIEARISVVARPSSQPSGKSVEGAGAGSPERAPAHLPATDCAAGIPPS